MVKPDCIRIFGPIGRTRPVDYRPFAQNFSGHCPGKTKGRNLMPNDEELKKIKDFPTLPRPPLALPDHVIRLWRGLEPFFLDLFAAYPVDCDSPKRYLFASGRKTPEISFVRSAQRIAANHLVTLRNEILYSADSSGKETRESARYWRALAKMVYIRL
jgi:hypothetical protein